MEVYNAEDIIKQYGILLDKTAQKNILEIPFDNISKNSLLQKVDNLSRKISVIIPTYNRKKQLFECIISILRQTYINFEIIIIDDNSSDNTKQMILNIDDERIHYYCNKKNMGVGYNRYKGYNLSKGDFVIFCDDDDFFIDNNYFEKVIELFHEDDINIICANSFVYYEKTKKFEFNALNFTGKIDSYEYLQYFQFQYSKPNSTFCAVFRKKILEKAHFEDMKMMNDSSIYLRALTVEGFCWGARDIVGIYRIHNKNLTSSYVSADFIIQNFEEKRTVYNYIKNHNLISHQKKWFEKQISITTNYFLHNYKNTEELKQVLIWIRNCVSFKLYFKTIMKILLKRVVIRK